MYNIYMHTYMYIHTRVGWLSAPILSIFMVIVIDQFQKPICQENNLKAFKETKILSETLLFLILTSIKIFTPGINIGSKQYFIYENI